MKKIGLLVMPLMATSFLVGCGGGSKPAVTYKVTVVGDHSHLSFTTTDDKPLEGVTAVENQDFTFKMKATTESNSEGFKIPTELKIFIGDSTVELSSNYYTITPVTPQLEAIVSINKSKITDDIKISGEAIPQGYYAIDVDKCFGVTAAIESAEPPYIYNNEEGVIAFTQQSTYALPSAENILVKFDGNDWIVPTDDSEWCTYDSSTHKLTIKKDKAVSNVKVAVRSPDYPILDELKWKDINDYSNNGYAPFLFYVGDTKTVKVNGLDHKVRIIGFGHDDLATGTGKAGITFEFVNLITNYLYTAVTSRWDNVNNQNFPSSVLNIALNDSIFTILPLDLQGVIKLVNKKVAQGESYSTYTPYPTLLFPLSHSEVSLSTIDGEGFTYQYYAESVRLSYKCPAGGTVPQQYWLRSPTHTPGYPQAWHGSYDGGYRSEVLITESLAVAPAFCI